MTTGKSFSPQILLKISVKMMHYLTAMKFSQGVMTLSQQKNYGLQI